MDFFKKKPTTKEIVRQNDRSMNRTKRDMQREDAKLEREEKRLEIEIKKAAKQGNNQAAKVLAKQLITLRKQRTRSVGVQAKVTSLQGQQKVMHSNMKMAEAMAGTTKAMQSMNKVMDPMKTAKTMEAFSRESQKMDMTEEMINDTLDDILDESGDEEESDAIVTQVLDEIGIDMTGKMVAAPSAPKGAVGTSSESKITDDDIERQLAALKDL